MFFFFWFQVYEVEHCLCRHFTKSNFVRFETMIWPSIEFIKSLDIFWPELERSRSEEYLDYFEIKVVKRSFERCSCLEFILKNSNRNTAKICKVLIMTEDFQRHFSFNIYIYIFVNKHCCPFKCFIEWYYFLVLIVCQAVSFFFSYRFSGCCF